MEIGSFIELDLKNAGEYYHEGSIARLNAARGGIYHALRVLNCTTIYLPFYQCESVKRFLDAKNINLKFYSITENFEPLVENIIPDSAILVVNYFGILGQKHLKGIASRFKNVIIDNCQAFYNAPFEECLNVYSPRKFFGVPDGCYLIGNKADKYLEEYQEDLSSETSNFLFKRIELGCSASYPERMKNEHRIDNSDVLRMSKLTYFLLRNIDYEEIRLKRIENFFLAHQLYCDMNLIDTTKFLDESNVPMVYPLVLKDADLVKKLNKSKIYTGRWWNYVLNFVPENSFEALLSKYMVPIPIDQRYDNDEIQFVHEKILETLS
ncbi:MAG: hypothetical protein NTY07_12370 [Bacteroidia bacterium]|nr:hypothetical protein [Bacteroidia bacterium]